MKTFFTSDSHHLHSRILQHQPNRGVLFNTIEEHDEELIRRWNSVVTKNDTVWHLGDVFMGNVERAKEIMGRLNFRSLNLIKGNHDEYKKVSKLDCFDSIQDVKMIVVDGQKIFLSHYSHQVWPGNHKGSFHLFGHSHGSCQGIGKSFDVGVDAHDLYPISFDQVKKIMSTKSFTPTDKHGEKRIDLKEMEKLMEEALEECFEENPNLKNLLS